MIPAWRLVIYRVSNKTFSILFKEKTDAEKFCFENGTVSNGLEITEVQVF